MSPHPLWINFLGSPIDLFVVGYPVVVESKWYFFQTHFVYRCCTKNENDVAEEKQNNISNNEELKNNIDEKEGDMINNNNNEWMGVAKMPSEHSNSSDNTIHKTPKLKPKIATESDNFK